MNHVAPLLLILGILVVGGGAVFWLQKTEIRKMEAAQEADYAAAEATKEALMIQTTGGEEIAVLCSAPKKVSIMG